MITIAASVSYVTVFTAPSDGLYAFATPGDAGHDYQIHGSFDLPVAFVQTPNSWGTIVFMTGGDELQYRGFSASALSCVRLGDELFPE